MNNAGWFGSEYTTVPLAAVDHTESVSSTTDKNCHTSGCRVTRPSYQPNYQRSHEQSAPTQETDWSTPGRRHHPTYPPGFTNLEGHGGLSLQAPSNQPPEWFYRNEQGRFDTVTVPQAVRYMPAGWTYHGNAMQHWGDPLSDEIAPAGHARQHHDQHHFHATTRSGGRDGGREASHGLRVPGGNQLATTPLHSDGWQHRNALVDPTIPEHHPRQDLAAWKWKLVLVSINILWLVTGKSCLHTCRAVEWETDEARLGYDVSNIANIQAPIYTAFHNLEIFPWVALSYSICSITVTPLARKLFKFYDIKILTTGGLALVIAGTSVAAAAANLRQFIIGRAIMAFGASVVHQG